MGFECFELCSDLKFVLDKEVFKDYFISKLHLADCI